MLSKLYRLLAPEGDSPGGGAPPAAQPAPAAPAPAATPAQGNAPTFDSAALAREVAASVRDSVFAELRKSGALKKEPAAPPPDKEHPTPPAGAVDVEALIERRESLALALGRYDIPDTAIDRARKSFKAENPTDVGTWVAAFATDMGWRQRNSTAQPAPAGPPATPTPTIPVGPPVTGGGPPPPSNPVRTDTPIHKLSIPDREALRRQVGDIEFKNRLFREMASVQITGVRR